MPEVRFVLKWPDGTEEECYSPSTVITRFFTAGETYPLDDALARARTGLGQASDRVAEKFGFACSSAMAQLDRIEARHAEFAGGDNPQVTCTSISQ